MKKTEIKEYHSLWEESELLAIDKCPVCGHKAELIISIYEDAPCSCLQCGSEFVISQSTRLYLIMDDGKCVWTRTGQWYSLQCQQHIGKYCVLYTTCPECGREVEENET